jgi:quercetin 2,3-dioxygenase
MGVHVFNKRPSGERGRGEHGWLDSCHTFSFADYHDPRHMGFRTLRVMNEDRVAPSQGFGTHGHRDMEIISYVLSGGLQHRDSMGIGTILEPGDFQCMSAGSGITHSEFNASATEVVHFYQIWILPQERGLTPNYQELKRHQIDNHNRLAQVASPDGGPGILRIRQDASVWLGQLDASASLTVSLDRSRFGWLQCLRGSVRAGDVELQAGDGVAVSEEAGFELIATSNGEVLWFDLG